MRFMYAPFYCVEGSESMEEGVGDRSRMTALTTMYIIVESVMMLNVSQISLTLLSDLTHLTTPESQHHVLASTEDNQRWPAESLYVSRMNKS